VDKELVSRLEPLLRQAQLLLPVSEQATSASDLQNVYETICELVLDEQVISSLWHEPILLQLNWLFKLKPPLR